MDVNLNYGQQQKTSNPAAAGGDGRSPFERFEDLTKKLFSVPKKEMADLKKKAGR